MPNGSIGQIGRGIGQGALVQSLMLLIGKIETEVQQQLLLVQSRAAARNSKNTTIDAANAASREPIVDFDMLTLQRVVPDALAAGPGAPATMPVADFAVEKLQRMQHRQQQLIDIATRINDQLRESSRTAVRNMR